MEVDSSASPQVHITERLSQLGIPRHFVDRQHRGLVSYLEDNEVDMAEVIEAIFPADEEVGECLSYVEPGPLIQGLFRESMVWMLWLMFKGDPGTALDKLPQQNASVCSTVWGHDDIAYRCRTCQVDPSCQICVSCFQNGDHEDHDYWTIHTAGGCCDCGDVTAWKCTGFCLKHKGTGHIQPLPSEIVNSMGPIFDSLFCFWRDRLVPLQIVSEQSPTQDHISQQVQEKLTIVVVELLLEFCGHNEGFLSFISEKVYSLHGLMEILVRVERFFCSHVVSTLHELLLKLLVEPQFKYEFAKEFIAYYPTVITEAIEKSNDKLLEKYPLLRTFSVQIFMVPTLTTQFVKELNLFPVLLDCLENIFLSCVGDDGRLEAVKWSRLYATTIHVVENIQCVMSHSAVPIYVIHERQDITRRWMRILSVVQGMYPQKRETSVLAPKEKLDMSLPFYLGYGLAHIHSYLLGGAFSDVKSEGVENESGCNTFRQELEQPDNVRQTNTGRISQECSVSSLAGKNSLDHTSNVAESEHNYGSIPSSVFWLTFECLKTIDSWLVLENSLSHLSSSASSGEVLGRQNSIAPRLSILNLDSGSGKYLGQEAGGSGSDEISTETECSTELKSLKVLSLSEWPDHVAYDVSLLDISTQIPLHRLLSMILRRSLICYDKSAFLNEWAATSGWLSNTTSDDFFFNFLGECHPCGFSAFLMEHPLRIRVFNAQVRAGLWRSNGNATTITCNWYHSGRCSEKGLELDLFLLQCCAAIAPADLFVKRILDRYGLFEYLELNLEQSSEYEPFLVQEMLTLIIQIVKERRFCGLTNAECLRRELVYKLSLGDATHSELVKFVPMELLEIGDLQQILGAVAVYSNPHGLDKGIYKLRLECWKELDMYHPRCNSTDLKMAEENCLRFCNISAVTTQLPKWSKIYQPLSSIARVATCETVLQLVRAVLFYAFSNESMLSRALEGVIITAMHLLSLALDICSLQRASGQSLPNNDKVIPILEFSSEDISSSRQQSLLSLLLNLMRLCEKEKIESFDEGGHSNISSLCGKILKKFAELEPKCFVKLQKIAPEVVNQLPECSSNLDGLASDSEKRKAEARERQAAVLEKMKAQQATFLENIKSTGGQEECGEDLVDNEVLHDSKDSEEVVCCLCHETNSKTPVCFLIHIQKSRLLSFLDRAPISWGHSSQFKGDHFSPGKSAQSSNNISSDAYDGFGTLNFDGIFLYSCRHAVHEGCLELYLSSSRNGYVTGRITFDGWHTFDPEKGEFPCPVCRGLANSFLPMLPNDSDIVLGAPVLPNVNASDAGVFSASTSTEVDSLRIQEAASLMESAASVAGKEELLKLIPLQQFQSNLDPLFRALSRMYFPSQDKTFESGSVSHSLLLWEMLKYSVASTEIAGRSGKRFSTPTPYGSDFSQKELLILSLLLNTAQVSRTENITTLSLRFRGIQLFLESLCLGSSNVEQNRQEDCEALDIQFWKRASDPVLARDSFASLMWALFCLPNSLLSCKNSFFCLVHIFYLVTITQAIVICFRKRQSCLAELGAKDSLITDICKAIGHNEIPLQYIDSSHIDSYNIKDAIRSLSSPFLRRCSFLWGLVNISASGLFSQGNHVCYESSDMVINQSNVGDILEVKRLELMFNIPSIDMIINDDMSRFMATRWLHHFLNELKLQGQKVLYCTPLNPFSLMILPKLYEQLLQQYIKQHCPDCGAVLEKPALCLLCGKLCGPADKPCCRENQCQTHAVACGAGMGVFLLIKWSAILLLRGDQHAEWPSPYLDIHGEVDIGLVRGRRLYLNEERYAALSHMVTSHALIRRG